jgi:hypothetical protein
MVVSPGVHSPTKNSQNGKNTQLRLRMQNSAKILSMHNPNNVCRSELGLHPLIIQIQKITVKFHNHLMESDAQTFHYKALTYREMNLEKSPLSQLVMWLC